MSNRIEVFLNMSQSRWWWERGAPIPPTFGEAKEILKYLRDQELQPVIIGAAATYVLDRRATPKTFRPGARLDIFLHSEEPGLPPEPWKLGSSPTHWLSETEGHLNLVLARSASPDGGRYPSQVSVAPESDPRYPVAAIHDLIKLLLASMAMDNMPHVVALFESLGRFPSDDELGPMTDGQRWCLDWLRRWWKLNRERK